MHNHKNNIQFFFEKWLIKQSEHNLRRFESQMRLKKRELNSISQVEEQARKLIESTNE